MNTNDFYKELFEKYALDQDKIRLNALKQARQPAWQKAVKTYWKPVTGIAAAVALTVGVGAFALGNSSGIDITVSPDTALSASQRLREAEANYYNLDSANEDTVSIYLTFMEPLSYSDMIVALSAVPNSEDITVGRLYLQDGSIIEAEDIASFASEKSSSLVAAKIYSYSHHYRDIQDLSSIYLAELGSIEINDNTFTPVSVDDSDPLTMDSFVTSVTEQTVPVTTTPFSFEEVTTAPPVVSETTVSESETETDETEISQESEDITTLPPEGWTGEIIDTPEETYPSETTDVTTEVTEAPSVGTDIPVSEITSPGGIGLMTEIYQLNVPNSLNTAVFNDYAVVLTKSEVYIYVLGGTSNKPAANVVAIGNPKISYSDDKSVVITGCNAEGLRNTMIVLDLVSNGIYTYDVSTNLGVSEIGAVYYSSSSGKYFVKAVSGSTSFVYEVVVTPESGVAFRPLVEFEAAVFMAGYSAEDNKLYLCISEDNISSSLYEFSCSDGTSVKISDFEGVCGIKRSPGFESFLLITNSEENGSFVYDTASDALIPVYVDKDCAVGMKNGAVYLKNSEGMFSVTSEFGMAPSLESGVVFDKESKSGYYVLETTPEKVVIAQNNTTVWQE